MPKPDSERARVLRNKQEIVVPALPPADDEEPPVVYSTAFVKKTPLHRDTPGGRPIVLLTDRSGATRIYAAGQTRLESWNRESEVIDGDGQTWAVTEEALVSPSGHRLPRIPSHRAFWFGWLAQFPDTKVVR